MLFEERADLGEAEGEDEDVDEKEEEANQSHADEENDAGGHSDEAKGVEESFSPSGSAEDSRRNKM